MSEQEPSTYRPFVFTVVEDDGVNVIIEVAQDDYLADLAAGIRTAWIIRNGEDFPRLTTCFCPRRSS